MIGQILAGRGARKREPPRALNVGAFRSLRTHDLAVVSPRAPSPNASPRGGLHKTSPRHR